MQAASSGGVSQCYDVVGPVCESGDFLGKDRDLTLAPGDLLAVRSAGAYSFVMSSNYNTRPRAAEILVDGDQAHLVRKRETYADLLAHESLIEN
jgi:diaminopimelate decarboxylase